MKSGALEESGVETTAESPIAGAAGKVQTKADGVRIESRFSEVEEAGVAVAGIGGGTVGAAQQQLGAGIVQQEHSTAFTRSVTACPWTKCVQTSRKLKTMASIFFMRSLIKLSAESAGS